MSGDGYSSYSSYYHHPQNAGGYPVGTPAQSWNNWNMQQQQQQYLHSFPRTAATYNSSSVNHNSHASNSTHTNTHNNFRPQSYHNSPTHANRPYYRNRFNANANNQFSGNPQHGPNWQRNQNNYKRSRLDSAESEPQLKTTKKKKKPLSQNIPSKKEWTLEEAEEALLVEKEHNKKSKNALIIKFPDQELNKDIVAKFHTSIENVHFQQPCTPRFCFVTLQESADPEEVISALNKQKFGDGCLSVEYKKDREEDQAVSAEDIDPLTLYVGNLAQEVTKDNMVTMYPNAKRIDIGFAKKMKFTRYAFVTFRAVADSIEAFKNTHNTQMYNKSLIVRFRRLHGTVGMPGESKPQNPPKTKDDLIDAVSVISDTTTDRRISANSSDKTTTTPYTTAPERTLSSLQQANTPSLEETCDTPPDLSDVLSLEKIKQEPDSEDEMKHRPIMEKLTPSFMPANLEEYVLNHRPIIKKELDSAIKKEIDKTPSEGIVFNVPDLKTETPPLPSVSIKDEPDDSNDGADWNGYYEHEDSDGDDADSNTNTDFQSLYESMVNHANRISSLKKTES